MDANEHPPNDLPPAEVPQWRAFIESKWEELRRRALGLEPSAPRKLAELSRECQALAALNAWYESDGNITLAALRLGTSRRVLRDRLTRWRRDHPQTPVPPNAKVRKPSERTRKSGA